MHTYNSFNIISINLYNVISHQAEHCALKCFHWYNIVSDGEITSGVVNRTAKASRAFGCLRKPSYTTQVYQYQQRELSIVHVISALWSRIMGHHSRCVWIILGVTKYKQWRDRITSKQLAFEFSIEKPIFSCRLRWLGHLGHIEQRKTTKEASAWRARKWNRPCLGQRRDTWGDGVPTGHC